MTRNLWESSSSHDRSGASPSPACRNNSGRPWPRSSSSKVVPANDIDLVISTGLCPLGLVVIFGHDRRERQGFRAGCPLPASFLGCSALQQLVGFDTKCLGQLPYDLQACVEGALLELTQIAPAHLRFIGEIVLREPLLIADSAQVGDEHVSQIHPRSGATSSKCAPRYIERVSTRFPHVYYCSKLHAKAGSVSGVHLCLYAR